jgi:hypothetical protein
MPASSESQRIFVSYARSDGTAFARGLRAELEDKGLSLWHDLPSMTPGDDWWDQITRAIDGAEYMVMVMTKASLESRVCGREWRYARQVGTCVVPVKAAPDLDFAAMPSWMRSADFVDLSIPERKARFFELLRGACRAARVPQMAKPPPPDFVMRSEAFGALKARLLEGGEPVAITAALKGAGGFGKTTLAQALCHDDDVQEAFHHGILWITLGQTPGDLTGRIVDLIETLTGERRATPRMRRRPRSWPRSSAAPSPVLWTSRSSSGTSRAATASRRGTAMVRSPGSTSFRRSASSWATPPAP